MDEDKRMKTSLNDLVQIIRSKPPINGDSYIIGIDGPAGAGKSTLAQRIASSWPTKKPTIIHMDYLYDGWENALTEQLTKVLENQILKPLSMKKRASIRKYDWLNSRFSDFVEIEDSNLYILEGVGSGQRASRKYLDQLIWIDIEPEVGLNRVLQRDGDYLESEMRIWQMRERSHFEVENTRDCATFRFDGSLFI